MIRDACTTALQLLRAIAEPTRAHITGMFLERGGFATVGDIQAALGLPQFIESRHLRILLDHTC